MTFFANSCDFSAHKHDARHLQDIRQNANAPEHFGDVRKMVNVGLFISTELPMTWQFGGEFYRSTKNAR